MSDLPRPTAGPFSLGSNVWPGAGKLAEETGELLQVIGKLIASAGETQHWDGTDLAERLSDELADVTASIRFLTEQNNLDAQRITERAERKLAQYRQWHQAHSTRT